MGVDICTFRVRIGCFVPFGRDTVSCSPVWFRPGCAATRICVGARLTLAVSCIWLLLICAGDVETNPGPDKSDQVLAAIKEMRLVSENFQKEVLGKIKDVQLSVTEIKRRLSKLEDSSAAVTDISKEVNTLGAMLKESQNRLQSIETTQTRQSSKLVDDLNNRMRRNNLIFKGIAEQTTETWKDTEDVVTKL